jgi:hypothetical protein
MGARQILREVGFSHKPLRLHLARLERQGILGKANSTCAPKLPPKPQKGINTIFNHFCNRLARANLGSYQENFSLSIYANTTCIATMPVTLSSQSFNTVTLTSTTTNLTIGNYVLTAYASIVPGENSTANNMLTKITVTVTIPGDINGDFKVSLQDLVLLANAYGSKPGDVRWNPDADINCNAVVDLADLVILAQDYGQHYP